MTYVTLASRIWTSSSRFGSSQTCSRPCGCGCGRRDDRVVSANCSLDDRRRNRGGFGGEESDGPLAYCSLIGSSVQVAMNRARLHHRRRPDQPSRQRPVRHQRSNQQTDIAAQHAPHSPHNQRSHPASTARDSPIGGAGRIDWLICFEIRGGHDDFSTSIKKSGYSIEHVLQCFAESDIERRHHTAREPNGCDRCSIGTNQRKRIHCRHSGRQGFGPHIGKCSAYSPGADRDRGSPTYGMALGRLRDAV